MFQDKTLQECWLSRGIEKCSPGNGSDAFAGGGGALPVLHVISVRVVDTTLHGTPESFQTINQKHKSSVDRKDMQRRGQILRETFLYQNQYCFDKF